MNTLLQHIDHRTQTERSKNSEFLTFVFRETDGSDKLNLELAQWQKIESPSDRPTQVRAYTDFEGCRVPIVDASVKYGGPETHLTEKTCVILFEYSQPHKHYIGIFVDGIARVMNIAEIEHNLSSSILKQSLIT